MSGITEMHLAALVGVFFGNSFSVTYKVGERIIGIPG